MISNQAGKCYLLVPGFRVPIEERTLKYYSPRHILVESGFLRAFSTFLFLAVFEFCKGGVLLSLPCLSVASHNVYREIFAWLHMPVSWSTLPKLFFGNLYVLY